jgi:Mg2+ and Co2+ transporter CorA
MRIPLIDTQLYNVLDYQTSTELSNAEQQKAQDRFQLRQLQEDDRQFQKIERQKTSLERAQANYITQMTVRDTVGMKLMTIVALVYLPPNFVAVGILRILAI